MKKNIPAGIFILMIAIAATAASCNKNISTNMAAEQNARSVEQNTRSVEQNTRQQGRASIHPSIVTLDLQETAQFKVIQMATYMRPARLAENVEWSVNGIPGGNSRIGTISSEGLYTAPAELPEPHIIHIVGQTDQVQNSTLVATVKVGANRPCFESVFSYSEPRDGSEYFFNPHGITLDADGNIAIIDEVTHYAVRFSPEGEFLGYIGEGPGQVDGQTYRPRVILNSPDNEIYITDQKLYGNRIQVFSNDGQFLRSFGPRGHAPGRSLRIHGLDLDSHGNAFVIDSDNSRVTGFTPEGKYLKSWGQDGERREDFNAPHGLVIDSNDDVFIGNYFSGIQKFDSDGNYLLTFGRGNPPGGSVYIHAISIDQWGNVYSMMRGRRGFGYVDVDNIEMFNNNGDFVCGARLSERDFSANWAYINENGYIYVAFSGGERTGFEILAPK